MKGFDTAIFVRIPLKLVIVPLLKAEKRIVTDLMEIKFLIKNPPPKKIT